MKRRDGRGPRRRRRARRAYGLLVRLYPAAHRREFGAQMVQTFGDHYDDAVEGRGDSRLRFWLAVLTDIAASLLTEHAAALRARLGRARAGARRRPAPPNAESKFGRTSAGSKFGRTKAESRIGGAKAGSRLGRMRAGSRRARAQAQRGRSKVTRSEERTTLDAPERPLRVRRRLRYHRPVRVLVRTRRHRLLYRGRIDGLIALAVAAGAAFGASAAAGHPGLGGLLSGLVLTVWLAYHLRVAAPMPHGDGPAPPGGASVREPRRPLPMSPAGSCARPRPDEDEPGPAVALI